MADPLLTAYRDALPLYEARRQGAIRRLDEALQRAGLKIHGVTGRVKRPESLAEKLRRKPGRYASLDAVTDLVAVRVITYFESDVWEVSKLLEAGFTVDWAHSIDKSRMHDPDRFGYMGVHYVVELAGGPVEVQIRSILQHAWAEIEHDLGYKSPASVPREIRRRLSRLAGLLETADEEFMAVDRLARDYAATLPERIARTPDAVFVDAQSVAHLLGTPEVQDLDARIAGRVGSQLLDHHPDPERTQRLVSLLDYVGVRSVGQLLKELRRLAPEVVTFAAALLPLASDAWRPAGGVRPGSSLIHYGLWRVCADPSLDPFEAVRLLDLGLGDLTVGRLAGLARRTYAGLTGAGQA